MSEDFGNSWKHLKTALLIGGVIGTLAAVATPLAAWQDGRPLDWAYALTGGVIVGLMAPIMTALTLLVSIRIEDGLVSQRLLRRWRLSEGRVEDLTQVEFGCGKAAARLHFEGGTCVSLPMADARELQALCVHLMERRPDFNNFVFGPRAAPVAKVVQAFRAASAHAPHAVRRKRHDRAEPGIATRAIPWGGLRRTTRVA